MRLNRQQLGQVFTDHETLRAFEQALNALDGAIPSSIDEATALATLALAAAQSAMSALADALSEFEGVPAALPVVDADDMTPRVHLGTIASQNADNVDISGGSITGMTKNDATGVALADDTTTNATTYPVFGTAAGTSPLKISSTKLTWNPSTGLLSAPSVSAQLNGTLGLTTPAAAAVTTLSASGQFTSTVATGTAPFSISSTTVVPNLNVSQLLGGTWAIPGAIGSTTPNTGSFTTLTASAASFAGTPTAPTAAVDTNTTQISTCAFVLGQAASATPLINGTAAVGTSTRYARGDHVHPTDTGREPAITAGTTAQYWRGDKSFQTLNQAAVAGLKTTDKPQFAGITPYTAQIANVGPGTTNIATTSDMGGICIITARQGGVGTSTRIVAYNNRGGTLTITLISTTVVTSDPVSGVAASGANIQVTLGFANTNVQYGFVDIPT